MAGRADIVGREVGPETPFPYKMEGKVISGFGRGSKEVSEFSLALQLHDSHFILFFLKKK